MKNSPKKLNFHTFGAVSPWGMDPKGARNDCLCPEFGMSVNQPFLISFDSLLFSTASYNIKI